MPDRVAVVEDDHELRALLVEVLEEAGYETAVFDSADVAIEALESDNDVDVVVSDLIMPRMHGDELLRRLRACRPELNVIIITAFGSIQSAIELTKAGAFDYVTKPFTTDELLLTVERALSESRLRREVADLRRETRAAFLNDFVGASPQIRKLFHLIARAGQSRHAVLVTGETGSGKELVARAIHRASGRGEFVPVNSGALPEHLLESELFGHEKGAFTGAERMKPGLLEAADSGTLFIDEIGELPLTLQPKLLRVLEDGEVRRVGATQSKKVDVRIIAATHRDLEHEVSAGRFRHDLYWRLSVLNIPVPSLRERLSDIPMLVEHFLDDALDDVDQPKMITAEAMAALASYTWPGNVRELRNVVHQSALMTASAVINVSDLPPRIQGQPTAPTNQADRQPALREVERAYVLEVLRRVGGNKSRAAEILGFDRKTLYRRLEEYQSDQSTTEV